MKENIIATAATTEDQELDRSLRPKTLDAFIGQDRVKEQLSVFMPAAMERNEPLDHVLLYGPPGLGKTTLSQIIAAEMGAGLTGTSGPVIERPIDLSALLSHIKDKDIIFIDEIHRLNHSVEEILYPAMEDFKLDIIVGKGPGARTVKLDLPSYTLIGATTRAGMITAPLRARFGLSIRLGYYGPEDMKKIVKRSAAILDVDIEEEAAAEIARRSRGTPRISNRLLKRVRDYAQVRGDGNISMSSAKEALKLLEVDEHGLDDMDKFILSTIIEKFNGGPVGLNTIATAVGEEKGTIEEVYEPYLVQEGYMDLTRRGRTATRKAYERLGKGKDREGPWAR